MANLLRRLPRLVAGLGVLVLMGFALWAVNRAMVSRADAQVSSSVLVFLADTLHATVRVIDSQRDLEIGRIPVRGDIRSIAIVREEDAPVLLAPISHVGGEDRALLVAVNGAEDVRAALGSSRVSSPDGALVGSTPELLRFEPSANGPIFGVAYDSRTSLVVLTHPETASVSLVSAEAPERNATVGVGEGPMGVVIDPNNGAAYIANSESDSVSVVDLYTLTVSTTIGVGKAPVALAFANGRLFVANAHDKTISVIAARTLTVERTIPLAGMPYALLADGNSRVFIGNVEGGTISVLDARTLALGADIYVSDNVVQLALSPDARKLYAIGGYSGAITVVDTVERAVLDVLQY